MTDLSKMRGEQISKLAGAYLHAAFVFDVDPLAASEQKQRKIRKWISNQYIELVHELPKEANIFSIENEDKEVLSFLKACLTMEEESARKREENFGKDFSALELPSRSALKRLQEITFWPEIQFVGNDIRLMIDDTPAFRRVLTLKNADAVPKDKSGYYCHDLAMVLKKEQNRFCFYGGLEDPVTETAEIFALTFENAEVEVALYNACSNTTVLETPWDLLRTISCAICMKAELPGEYCNAQEKELLLLMKQIAALSFWLETPAQERLSFCELKALTRRYGHQKAEKLFGKLETVKPGDPAFYKTVQKLTAFLCEKRCEPLWREIYHKISASQAEYPNKVDCLCEKDLLAGTRSEIQTRLTSKGYTGTYPDFVKVGALKGIRLEHSYNMTYFVGMEKRAVYHIHCTETLEESDYLTVQFLSGTAFLKQDEQATDVYDCLFNAKGRRLFHTVHHSIPLQTGEDTEADDLESSVTIAVKKAECIKLTKAEQKEYYGKMIPGWGMFWWIFLIAGGLFGIAMTLIAMLVCMLTTAAFGLFSDIPEMLKTMPWGSLLAIGWIGFGGAMGIVEVLAHRK